MAGPVHSTYAAKADAVTKLFTSGIIPREAAREQMGWSSEYRRHLRSLDDDDPAVRYLEQTMQSVSTPEPEPVEVEE